MGASAESLLQSVLWPVSSLITPGRRTYWGFLAGALVLALLVWCRKARHISLKRFLFAPAQWLHPSAVADYGFVFVRAVTALSLAPLTLSSLALASAIQGASGVFFGAPPLTLPPLFVAVMFSLLAFVADDGSRYLVHRAMHRIPALWAIHQVHHSAEVLTPITVYRVHPVEECLHRLRGRLVLGLVAGVFAYLAPGTTWLEILGVDLLSFTWGALGANLRHSQIWLSYGAFEHLLISPAQHQIHHSAEPAHHNRNFGSALALWDWLGGTLILAGQQRVRRFGIASAERNHPHAPIAMFWRPLVAACKTAFSVQSSSARGRNRGVESGLGVR